MTCPVSCKVNLTEVNAITFSDLKLRVLQAISFFCRRQWWLRQVSFKWECSFAKTILTPLLAAPGFLWWAVSTQTPFLICSRATLCACVLQSPGFCKIIGTKHWESAQEPLALRRDQIHLDHQQMSVCPRRTFKPPRTDSTTSMCLFLCFPVWKIRKKGFMSN